LILIARSIYLAAQLGIADRLTMPLKRLRSLPQKPKPIRDRCIDSCVIWQAWTSLPKFQINVLHLPLAATLQSDVPGSMRYAAIAQMGYDHSLGWINGLSSLKTVSL